MDDRKDYFPPGAATELLEPLPIPKLVTGDATAAPIPIAIPTPPINPNYYSEIIFDYNLFVNYGFIPGPGSAMPVP